MELYVLTDNMILEKIGENIKRMRLEHNISQKELAGSAGVALSSIAALERGENVSLKTLIPLLRALNSLHILSDLLKRPEISPIAYAKLLDSQKTRKRASATKNNNDKSESKSEW
ncbi:MAG: helix-turn-helix transcriptional regulator [Bacteroidaceae bacterium]|nr:helix-turn-helix transcriptional regulator [Bacteroidaceae bacterium]